MIDDKYKLTTSQKTIEIALSKLPFPQFGNVCCEFTFKTEMNVSLLIQAISNSLTRNINNYARYFSDKNDKYFTFPIKPLNKVEYIEFNDEKSYLENSKNYSSEPFPNKCVNTQLVKARVIKNYNGNILLQFVGLHFIYDAYSLFTQFRDILFTYKALLNHKPIPKDIVSPFKALEYDYNYVKSKKRSDDYEHVKKVFESEPYYTSMLGLKKLVKNKRYGSFSISLTMNSEMYDIPIPRNVMDAIEKYSKDNGFNAQELFILAIRTYLSKVCNTDDVTIDSIIDFRPTIHHKNGGSSFADTIFLRTVYSNDLSFKEALKTVHDTVLEEYKHSLLGVESIQEIVYKGNGLKQTNCYETFVLTYQPIIYIDDEIKYSFRRMDTGKEVCNPYLSIMPCDTDMNYVANYAFIKGVMTFNEVKDFNDYIISFIMKGIENDSMPIKDIY